MFDDHPQDPSANPGALYDTIVAVFENAAQAHDAILDLRNAGIPEAAITQDSGPPPGSPARTAPKGLWASLFGGEPAEDRDIFGHGAATVVSVRAAEPQIIQVMQILEDHDPIDIDERAAVTTPPHQHATDRVETVRRGDVAIEPITPASRA